MDWQFKNISLYPKNTSAQLDPALFKNPTSEYRGTPFWSWNARLDKATLFRQIDALKEMGLGGFHMHARTGLATEYLGDEFMAMVRACTEKARDMGMISWLYDEDRWPSGFAGGLVTRDPAYRARYLLWTTVAYRGTPDAQQQDSIARASRQENGVLLGRYEVVLDNNGCLGSYRRLAEGQQPTTANARVWYAYLEVSGLSSWFNNQAYADTLSPKAIEKFIEVTHERYAKAVGEFFGNVVPAIFTDEPQFTHKQQLGNAGDTRDITMPFTTDFFATYQKAYGQNLEEYLPEIFWELPAGKPSLARYRYHDHVAERFSSAFADIVGKWCIDHGIALTGHMMEEPSLQSQTAALGEAMRSYRGFQLPGIDMLCDWREYTTAKQAQSAAHQYGRPGVLSELYGVTNWDFSFVGHKGQGDWQAALGVTVRVPHLAWVSMAGEAKRDYPAAIDYHSPWYKEYPLVENHFARVNVALTRGKPHIRVGVIHPVESYWLAFGPLEQTKMEREEREKAFSDITNWLLFGLVDFNYIAESLLPSQCPQQQGAKFNVGQMAYDVVIVPALRTIRATTLERLEAFARAGGRVVFAGQIPDLVDAVASDRPQLLADRCACIAMTRPQVLAAVGDVREVDIRHWDGAPADSILHQIRTDGQMRHIFFCNTDRQHGRGGCRISLRGLWTPSELDTIKGEARPIACEYSGGWTVIKYDFPAHGHLLLTLKPGQATNAASVATPVQWHEVGRLADPVAVTLSEPNVLLLDQAQWRVNDGAWQPIEESLRLENLVRKQLGLVERGGSSAQPWTDTASDPVVRTLELKFAIHSEIEVAAPVLALEEAGRATITLDGKPVSKLITGWWVDESIQTIPLPAMTQGTHELIVAFAFTRKTNIEWMYLLGDFGVAVQGRYARLTAPVRQLAFGDWTQQGLPFYAGNVTYHCVLQSSGARTLLDVPHFNAPVLSVDLDGKLAGKIAFAPFQLDLGTLTPGGHQLDITAYGNRINAFGALHNADEQLLWQGPNAWRQQDRAWANEYQLKRSGIWSAPMIRQSS